MPPYATDTPSSPEYLQSLPAPIHCWHPYTPNAHDTLLTPHNAPNTPTVPSNPPISPDAPYIPSGPEYLQSLPAPQYTPDTP